MPDSTELIHKAAALGAAIARHETVTAYVAAQVAIARDQEAQKVLGEYQRTADEIRQREAQGQPIEPEQKKRLMTAERALAGHETLKNWMRAQTDYIHTMNMINQAMEEPVAEAMQKAAQAAKMGN